MSDSPFNSPTPHQHQSSPFAPPPPKNLRKGLAIASLVIGIISIPTLGLFVVGALIGLALGIVALAQASNQPEFYGGKGIAIGGIATSVLSLALIPVFGIIGSIILPAMVKANRAHQGRIVRPVVETEAPQPASPQQEMAAIVALQKIHQCQMVFKAENQRFGTLRELAESNCLEMEYATTPVDNYLFYDAKPSEESYCIRAEPLQGTAEAKYFSVTQSGIVRVKSGEINVAVCGEGEPILNPQ